ncbi:CHAD domain-containing protein [Halomonas sp. 18H]|uniref:CHAD domain-containing protein n=1 Tax=Halomonas almeriensis TaxID=308163 RepID=UPI0022314544|nr:MULTISPECIES: CHAD domain-containing protein [Halomonas]MCW4150991.1 CHAD domain-containing protein [Halomonas sp. 18H]MDN3552867.1 CHAD domain-containing protein [Halomonas almeriensis]
MGKSLQKRRLERVVGDVGLELVKEARRARPRIMDPDDPEGLHDFRVALRRLRAWLQAYRQQPGVEVPKTLRRDLRDLARTTNAARDGEVMLVWLDEHSPGLPVRQHRAAKWWRQHLEAQLAEAYAEADAAIQSRFPELERRLRTQLEAIQAGKFRKKATGKKAAGKKAAGKKPRSGGRGEAPPRFGEATARVLDELRERLETEVAAVVSVEDAESLHRPRITGKRLRYLLRPWRKVSADCHQAERAMKAFQDAFGVLHDDLVREAAMQAAAREHSHQDVAERLAAAARGQAGQARAPAHLRGFMDLLNDHRGRVERHFDEAMGAAGLEGIEALSVRLRRAGEAMRR